MSKLIFVLGAADPEMEEIEVLLTSAGVPYVYATRDGKRVRPGTAYSATGTTDDAAVQRVADIGGLICLVECEVEGLPGMNVRVIDHHRPDDPGYGRPPSEFLAASSIGQVISVLAELGALAFVVATHEVESDHADDGEWLWSANRRLPSSASYLPFGSLDFGTSFSGDFFCVSVATPEARSGYTCVGPAQHRCVALIPRRIVLTAAADHCLGAAYRGECPGVDPDELMRFRAESRAKFQQRDVSDVLTDIEATKLALNDADVILLNQIDPYGYCMGCNRHVTPDEENEDWDYCECPSAADMRREPPWPELPEAATRANIPYISGPLNCPDGRRKITCSGTPDVIKAFMSHWATEEGLTDIYGDPERGFAGGYYT